MKKNSFIKDKYRNSRGGYSHVLELNCGNCKKRIAYYQKDGPGPLKRLYIDRIITPKPKIVRQHFRCQHCNEWLGMKYIYAKEQRPALKLFAGAIVKKRSSLKKIK